MANTVFVTFEDARRSLRDNSFAAHDKTGLSDTDIGEDLDLAARIAVFLCNPSKFETSLRNVSEAMWKHYIKLDKNEHNKFSRVISLTADPFGFQTSPRVAADPNRGRPMHIKLIGGDPGLGYMLRGGLFWKDSMHNRHGEFTHTLQWLAIANSFGRPAKSLYTRLGNYQAKTKANETAYLWQWLADCFPSDMKREADDTVFKNGETLESQSYRCPQVITDYLVRNPKGALKGHFISGYLHMRYRKREWLSDDKVDKTGKKLTLMKLQGDAIANAKESKVASSFANSTQAGPTGDVRYVRQPRAGEAAFGDTVAAVRTTKEYAVVFHDIAGKLYEGA